MYYEQNVAAHPESRRAYVSTLLLDFNLPVTKGNAWCTVISAQIRVADDVATTGLFLPSFPWLYDFWRQSLFWWPDFTHVKHNPFDFIGLWVFVSLYPWRRSTNETWFYEWSSSGVCSFTLALYTCEMLTFRFGWLDSCLLWGVQNLLSIYGIDRFLRLFTKECDLLTLYHNTLTL